MFGVCSAVLAHFILKEKLHNLGVLGCVMCIAGSIIIVIHAPQEHPITSVMEVWIMATQPSQSSASTLFLDCCVVLWAMVTNKFNFLFRFSALCRICNCVGFHSGLPFCTTMWAHKCASFHWHLFIDGFSVGKLFSELIILLILFHSSTGNHYFLVFHIPFFLCFVLQEEKMFIKLFSFLFCVHFDKVVGLIYQYKKISFINFNFQVFFKEVPSEPME